MILAPALVPVRFKLRSLMAALRATLHNLLVVALLWAVPGVAWSSPLTLLDDARALSPLRWETGQRQAAAGVTVGAVLLYQFDGEIRDELSGWNNPLAQTAAEFGNPLGDGRLLIPALAAGALWGRLDNRPDLSTTALRGLEAYLFNGVLVTTVKAAVGRARPNTGRGPHHYTGGGFGDLLSGDDNQSFPSGHTSSVFAVAGVVAVRHPSVAPWAYGAASLTGFARMNKDRHWASDVWVGAAIGVFVGRTVGRRSLQKTSLSLVPRKEGALVMWTLHD